MNKVQKKRLLNVAKALRESKEPEKFTMSCYGLTDCGTPACALGHYASRTDLQKTFRLSEFGSWMTSRSMGVFMRNDPPTAGLDVFFTDEEVTTHFGIDVDEALELFDTEGCGNAKTAIEAAEYIEQFVANKEAA